ncbi:unnamed protein product [Candidula unifasciata]|uniref:acylglycerol lipase n=1 Tax=Candidula unifasciata TaxID=100452 RepID=A0A8S4A7G1_9EUPU|nr:unnamed protein product [Candidula unifasciata]
MDTWMLVAVVAVGVVSTPACIFFILFNFSPHSLIRLSFRIRQYLAGMKIKYVGDENIVFCYGENDVAPRPDQPSIVFVHGFSSSKDQWITCFKGFPKDLHLIAVDLPGHGASSVPPEKVQLDLEYVVETLRLFIDLVGLKDRKVHLIGSSLGGAIVGLFAAAYPDRVEKLTMVCPAMQTPINSEFAIQVKEAIAMGIENITTSHCKLLPTDVPGVKAMLEVCCYSKDLINSSSDQMWKGFLNLRLPKTEFYLRLFKGITSTENLDVLERTAPKITVPTQLVWGTQDQVIHVSGAEVLRSKLPNCQRVDLIENCGHAIDIDRPGAFTKFLLTFIRSDVLMAKEDKKLQ